MEPIEKKKKSTRSMPVIRDYFTAAKKYPLLLFVLIAASGAYSVASVIAPLFIKNFIDIIADESVGTVAVASLASILGFYTLVLLVRWIIGRIQILSLVYLESKVIVDLYDRAFSYLIRHSHNFFTSNFAGTLQRRVSRYAQSFDSIVETFVFDFFSTGVFFAGAIFVLWQRSPMLGIAIGIWAIIFIYIQVLVAKYRHPLRIARAEAESQLTGVLSDSISNQSTVSQFAASRHEQTMLGGALGNWYQAAMRTHIADWWIWGIQGLFAVIIEVVLLFAAFTLWQQELLTVGDFVLIQIYVIGLIERISYIGNSIRRLFSAFADVQEMIDIFDTPYAIADKAGARPLAIEKGEISLDQVSFSFSGEHPVLSDFNLTIEAGEKVALVGPSGAGKSTVTKLLLRMYDVTDGSIRIDGQDIGQVTQESLRESISFVPQDPILFHRSLKDNIRYARPDATDEEVVDAAKKAHCHEFITGLKTGYDTHVGERGVKLSGGERQRVAIARAILKNAPILILDEATSALDSESEALIQDALRVLMEGKTVIVIAHRLSTIMTMDRIIVIEGGKIAAEGTHGELVTHKGGLYQKLWSIQAGGFLDDSKTV